MSSKTVAGDQPNDAVAMRTTASMSESTLDAAAPPEARPPAELVSICGSGRLSGKRGVLKLSDWGFSPAE
jgi:hypothetical protein